MQCHFLFFRTENGRKWQCGWHSEQLSFLQRLWKGQRQYPTASAASDSSPKDRALGRPPEQHSSNTTTHTPERNPLLLSFQEYWRNRLPQRFRYVFQLFWNWVWSRAEVCKSYAAPTLAIVAVHTEENRLSELWGFLVGVGGVAFRIRCTDLSNLFSRTVLQNAK